jgi:predicted SAM-dependent methyltransferase
MTRINDPYPDASSAAQPDPSHYHQARYDYRARFLSYWHQIDSIMSLSPRSVLEIGIGNSLVANYLKQRGLQVFTLDIDLRLGPDCAGSILHSPFSDQAFEAVACFEVLEHLPFQVLPAVLDELHRVSKRYVLVSVPDKTPTLRFYLQVPKLGQVRMLISIPKLFPERHTYDGQHYWEMGRAGFPVKRIREIIRAAGFDCLHSFRLFEHPSFHFLVLRRSTAPQP